MILLDCEQNSTQWFAARCGIPTASGFDKLITTKGEPSKQAQKYLWQLAGERITGTTEEGFKNKITERGNEVEAEARQFYELVNDCQVQKVGICYPDESKRYSCSPDGLVGDDGGVEIKCPIISTHVGYLINGNLATDYFQQVQGQLMITGRKWWDIISYYPGIKPSVVRVLRDESFIKSLAVELEIFCKNLDEITERIR